ncbi:MAG TPA: hypothetical protein VGJ82_08660, partial [Thermoanaerobaculia bacterium]
MLLVFASVILVIAIDYYPIDVANALGPLGVVFAAAICWVAIATVALYFALRYRIPIFTAAALGLVVFSYFNDNHAIGSVPGGAPKRIRIRAAFNEWAAAKLRANTSNPNRIPIFVVAAEGGGIRAAYWTATVLAQLQSRYPQFASHTFAISSVSGGSLGAATFLAALTERPAGRQIVGRSRAMLTQDFLAPLLGRLLFSDLIQQFVPVPVVRDRARAIENSWERSWGSPAFHDPFCRLWTRAPKGDVPNLMMNGTIVETGQRVIVSNLDIANDLDDTQDGLRLIEGDTSLACAIHLSARFTYVSPAGLIRPRGRPRGDWRHVVDG